MFRRSEDLARVSRQIPRARTPGPALRLSRCLRETASFLLPPCQSARLPPSLPGLASPSFPRRPPPRRDNMVSGDGLPKCRSVPGRRLSVGGWRRALPYAVALAWLFLRSPGKGGRPGPQGLVVLSPRGGGRESQASPPASRSPAGADSAPGRGRCLLSAASRPPGVTTGAGTSPRLSLPAPLCEHRGSLV